MENVIFFYTEELVKRKNKQVKRRVAYAGVQTAPGAMRIAKASCSPRDQFVKKVGRELAADRALKNPMDILFLTDDAKPSTQFIGRVKQLNTLAV